MRLIFLIVFLLGCTSKPGDSYPLKGLVLDVKTDSVIVDHEAIDGFMRAMVMRIPAENSEIQALKRGHRITASLRVLPDSSHLEQIAITGFDESLPDLNGAPHGLVSGDLFPTTQLHTAPDKIIQLGSEQEGVIALNFLFTTCPFPEACPLLASKLVMLQERIQGKARILSLTLDPETDTFELLEAYGKQWGADPDVWTFAREPLEKLEDLFDKLEMFRYHREGQIIHSLKLVVIGPKGQIHRIENDNGWDIEEIAADILALQQSAL